VIDSPEAIIAESALVSQAGAGEPVCWGVSCGFTQEGYLKILTRQLTSQACSGRRAKNIAHLCGLSLPWLVNAEHM
jgi:hypothetical protein